MAKTKRYTNAGAKEEIRAVLAVLEAQRRVLLGVARKLGDDHEGVSLASWLAGACKDEAGADLKAAIKALRDVLKETEDSLAARIANNPEEWSDVRFVRESAEARENEAVS